MKIELVRLENLFDCTVGVLIINGELHSYTLELPWRDNQRNVSCIPAGIYNCRPAVSPRFRNVIEVCGVPGRSHILIHAGNTARDTEGCILVGKSTGWLYNHRAVLESRTALLDLLKRVDKSPAITLKITEGWNDLY